MNEATRIAHEKITKLMELYPSIYIVPADRSENPPMQIQRIYNKMTLIDGKKFFEYKILGSKKDRILLIQSATENYPYSIPGEIMNDDKLGKNLVKRLADTWNITPDDISRWFMFVPPS